MEKNERLEACRQAAIIAMSRTIEDLQNELEKHPVKFPDLITLVFAEALGKFHRGAAKYGTFDPATDRRDFIRETESKILDAIKYLAMFLMKVRAIREREPFQAGIASQSDI